MNLNKELNLGKVEFDTAVKLISIDDHLLSERLLSLGFLNGALIKLKNKSPFGNAYLVEVNHRYVALRKEELTLLKVQTV